MSNTDKNTITYSQSWTALSLVNQWVDYGGVYSSPRYRRINGRVEIRGLVKNGSGTIAYLPAGFRPAQYLIFSTTTNPNVYGRINIHTDGAIAPVTYDNGWLSICCSFYAEQ